MSLQSQNVIGLYRGVNPTKNRCRQNVACPLDQYYWKMMGIQIQIQTGHARCNLTLLEEKCNVEWRLLLQFLQLLHCLMRPNLTFKEKSKKYKPSMKYRKFSSLTLTKHLCHTSAPKTALTQRKDPLTFRWLERERKNKSRKLSQLLCLDHFFPCSLSVKEQPIVAFQKVSIFLLVLMWHAWTITGAMSPKQFNT